MINNRTEHKQASALDLNSKYVKSYATEEMLVKKMEEAGIRHYRHIVVRTPSGRWTALVIGFAQELLDAGWPMVG